MPKAKNPLSPEEQQKRFEEEVRKREADGDFDPDAADAALDRLVRRSATSPAHSDEPDQRQGTKDRGKARASPAKRT